MGDLEKTIEGRHSTRAPYDPQRQVEKLHVKRIVEAGRWAPTAHNMQNFEIIVVDDKVVLKRLGDITTYPFPDFIRENFGQLSMTEEELKRKKVGILGAQFPPAWRDKAKLGMAMKDRTPGKLAQTIKGSPTLLVVVYDKRRRAPASEGDVLGTLSLGCVMENMWLMAHELGVGFQIMSAFSGEPEKEIMAILGIPDHMAISFAIRLGYPVTETKYLRVRRDMESFAFGNSYGRPYK